MNDVTENYLVTAGRAMFHSHLSCGLILRWHAASCREVCSEATKECLFTLSKVNSRTTGILCFADLES